MRTPHALLLLLTCASAPSLAATCLAQEAAPAQQTFTDQPATNQTAANQQDARPWWRDAVFYEIFVRSFADADHGPFAGDGKGDFQGLIDHLDFLNDGDPTTDTDLGVTALWLMPINESDSYHGYDIKDYSKVDAELGTNELFAQFVEECHKRGIRVIIDWVVNHTSWKHPWFMEAVQPETSKRTWYVMQNPRPQWKGPWNQNVWHDNARGLNQRSYYGVFSPTMPDLNLRNGLVTAEIDRAADLWLTDLNIDGFRLDAIKYLIETFPDQLENTPETFDWLANFRAHVHNTKPASFTVGEVWDDSETVHQYISNSSVDSAFEFDLSYRIIDAVRDGDAAPLRAQITKLATMYPADTTGAVYSTFLSNHDQTRTRTRLGGGADGGDLAKAKLAATIQLTLPGTPFIYYGEEIGMTGDKPDPNLRTPMAWNDTEPNAGFTTGTPWKALADDPALVSVTAADRPGGLREHYRSLIRLRADHPALRSDTVRVIPADAPGLLIYQRGTGPRQTLVVVNLGAQAAKLPKGLDLDGPVLWGRRPADGLMPPAAAAIFASDHHPDAPTASPKAP